MTLIISYVLAYQVSIKGHSKIDTLSADALTASFGNTHASNEFRQICFQYLLRCLLAGSWIPISELCNFPFILIIKSLADPNSKNLFFGVTLKTSIRQEILT